LCNVQDQK
jgi:hypothetical protein